MAPGRLKHALDLLATALVIGAAGMFISTQIESRWLRRRPSPQVVDVQNLNIEASKVRYAKGKGPVALVEFTDYECPFCRDHTLQTAPAVDSQLVDTGVLRHVIFNFPLEQIHSNARRAGEAAECAGRQGRYWEMHVRLFSDQRTLSEDALVASAKGLGLDEGSFSRCLSGEASERITADIKEGLRLGVRGTPTFFIGIVRPDSSIDLRKRISGVVSVDDLRRAIDMVSPTRLARR